MEIKNLKFLHITFMMIFVILMIREVFLSAVPENFFFNFETFIISSQ